MVERRSRAAAALEGEPGAGEIHGAGELQPHLGRSARKTIPVAGIGRQQFGVRPSRRRGDEHPGGGEEGADQETAHGVG